MESPRWSCRCVLGTPAVPDFPAVLAAQAMRKMRVGGTPLFAQQPCCIRCPPICARSSSLSTGCEGPAEQCAGAGGGAGPLLPQRRGGFVSSCAGVAGNGKVVGMYGCGCVAREVGAAGRLCPNAEVGCWEMQLGSLAVCYPHWRRAAVSA